MMRRCRCSRRCRVVTDGLPGYGGGSAKTITFAITHFFVAFSVAYLLTGDVLIGSLIAMVEPAINTVAYFIHEKIWARHQKGASASRADLHQPTV